MVSGIYLLFIKAVSLVNNLDCVHRTSEAQCVGVGGGGCHVMYGRSGMNIDLRILIYNAGM